jgi:hypothetical protein
VAKSIAILRPAASAARRDECTLLAPREVCLAWTLDSERTDAR